MQRLKFTLRSLRNSFNFVCRLLAKIQHVVWVKIWIANLIFRWQSNLRQDRPEQDRKHKGSCRSGSNCRRSHRRGSKTFLFYKNLQKLENKRPEFTNSKENWTVIIIVGTNSETRWFDYLVAQILQKPPKHFLWQWLLKSNI